MYVSILLLTCLQRCARVVQTMQMMPSVAGLRLSSTRCETSRVFDMLGDLGH